MKRLIQIYWPLATFVLVMGFIVTFAVVGELKYSDRMAEAMTTRKALCERICTDREEGVLQVDRQTIGFGSFEWRCYCGDGHWQAIP